ncbi:hypothetical protein GCM10027597_21540 [Saccharopolyspora tripterygii]
MPERSDHDTRSERKTHHLVATELARRHGRQTVVVPDARNWLQEHGNRWRADVILVPWSPAEAEVLRYALPDLEDWRILAASPRVAWANRRRNARARSAGEIPGPRHTGGQ